MHRSWRSIVGYIFSCYFLYLRFCLCFCFVSFVLVYMELRYISRIFEVLEFGTVQDYLLFLLLLRGLKPIYRLGLVPIVSPLLFFRRRSK